MDRKDAKFDRWVETSDGRLIGYVCIDGFRFDSKVKITESSIEIVNPDDANYKLCNFPDINNLVENNLAVEKFAFDRFEVCLGHIRTFNEKRISSIIRKFKRNGFNVTRDAIVFCYVKWKMGYKSGYRDEENGCHLSAPCGDSPLNFMASTLCELSNWQKTH